MADKALISELTWRSLKMQKDAFPDMPHYIAPEQISELLRKTTRKDTLKIHVLSLAVIADKEDDFIEAINLIRERKAHIISIEDNCNYHPDCRMKAILFDWKAARKNGAAKIGGKMSADKKKANSALAVAKIKDRWPLPSKEWPTKALLKEADISLNTAKKHLGRRPIEQANYQAKLKRAAKRSVA